VWGRVLVVAPSEADEAGQHAELGLSGTRRLRLRRATAAPQTLPVAVPSWLPTSAGVPSAPKEPKTLDLPPRVKKPLTSTRRKGLCFIIYLIISFILPKPRRGSVGVLLRTGDTNRRGTRHEQCGTHRRVASRRANAAARGSQRVAGQSEKQNSRTPASTKQADRSKAFGKRQLRCL
jgi:hypothetical protein